MNGDGWYIDLKDLSEEQHNEMRTQYDAWCSIADTLSHLEKETPRDEAFIKSLERRAQEAHAKFREIIGWHVHRQN